MTKSRQKGKANKSTRPRTTLFSREPYTLQSRRALYQLSYQGNSVGRGSNLQHNTRQKQTPNPCALAFNRQTDEMIKHPNTVFSFANVQKETFHKINTNSNSRRQCPRVTPQHVDCVLVFIDVILDVEE